MLRVVLKWKTPLGKVIFLAISINRSTKRDRTEVVTRVHTLWSRVISNVSEDMPQRVKVRRSRNVRKEKFGGPADVSWDFRRALQFRFIQYNVSSTWSHAGILQRFWTHFVQDINLYEPFIVHIKQASWTSMQKKWTVIIEIIHMTYTNCERMLTIAKNDIDDT